MKSPSLRQILWTLVLLAVLVLPGGLVSAETPEDPQIDVIFTGVLGTIGDTSWIVAGQTVLVDEQTRIRLTAGPAQPGMWAEVKADRQTDDSLLAKLIVVRRPEMKLDRPGAGQTRQQHRCVDCRRSGHYGHRSDPHQPSRRPNHRGELGRALRRGVRASPSALVAAASAWSRHGRRLRSRVQSRPLAMPRGR